MCSFLLFFISLWRIVNENFWIRSIKHIDNCRQCLILLIVPQDFSFEDNCNSSKNPSSIIRVPSPKTTFDIYLKNIRVIFLEDKQELIKRISLNTWILIVVFNEILIPQDSFSKTTIIRRKIRRWKSPFIFQNTFVIFKTFFLFLFVG